MKKCIIFTSYIEGDPRELTEGFNADLILCADGGYDHAKAAGITPDLLIGDLDSIQESSDPEVEKLIYPSEKDDTDTGICLQTALDRGCRDILILGGLGGRLDHTISNIKLITGYADRADRIMIKDRDNACLVLKNGSVTFNKSDALSASCGKQYISVFSMTEKSYGVTETGFKYSLDDATLSFGDTIGTSNEQTDDKATVSVKDGILLIVISNER